jgi:three-Cys-motif partner protein
MASRRRSSGSRAYKFGGDWTATKLAVLAGYLRAYTTALSRKPSATRPFQKTYIDAFAGTGYWDASGTADSADPSQTALLPDPAGRESQGFLDGSARIALKTEPRFDRFVFIERSTRRHAQLEGLKAEFPDLAGSMTIRRGEANREIQALCAGNWSFQRAVLFLDPHGMQVEWATIESVAATQAVDLWVLFPLGIAVNRLLTRSGDIPESWRRRLNALLGTEDWYDDFYKVEGTLDLFGGDEGRLVKASIQTIGRYFNDRLKSVFAAVAEEPKVLVNSTNCPLYLLCFAVGNPRGASVALRIASHLLTKGV